MRTVAADFGYKIEAGKFNSFCDELMRGLDPKQQEKLLRALGLKFVAEVIGGEPRTPVDTGRARAGWAAFADSEGFPLRIGGNPEGVAKGRPEGSFDLFRSKDGVTLQIRNAVPYIVPLEYGHSDQAPAGFVRIALRKLRTGIRGEALATLKEKIASANAKARATGLKWRSK